MRKKLLILEILIPFFLCGFCKALGEYELYDAKIISVIDGDTVKVKFIEKPPSYCEKIETVRLIGIDTPELFKQTPDYYSIEARNFTNKYYRSNVKIEFDSITGLRDKYGRLLSYIWLPNYSMLNVMLLESGFAYYYSAFIFSKEMMNVFSAAEDYARINSLGLWSEK